MVPEARSSQGTENFPCLPSASSLGWLQGRQRGSWQHLGRYTWGDAKPQRETVRKEVGVGYSSKVQARGRQWGGVRQPEPKQIVFVASAADVERGSESAARFARTWSSVVVRGQVWEALSKQLMLLQLRQRLA